MFEQDFNAQIKTLSVQHAELLQVIDYAALQQAVTDLETQAADPALWDNPQQAQKITSELSYNKQRLEQLQKIQQQLLDAQVLAELIAETQDADSATELAAELKTAAESLNALQIQTLLSGEYDKYPAVVTIRAGVGGVDAADFAQMLQRMYLRYGERNNYHTTVQETSYAEEAGIKSTTIEFDAPYAFGHLAVEAGTHRLVRISPFNAAGKRQTSFAAVEVIPLLPEAESVEIPENEIRVDVYRSSGPGGQSVNTTDSAVRITHLPTGIVVAMQNEKSQLQNRAAAMRVLQSRLLVLQREAEAAKKKELAGNITASWGDQMRSYVLAPYQMVKDLRTEFEVNNPQQVFDGAINDFIAAGIKWRAQQGR